MIYIKTCDIFKCQLHSYPKRKKICIYCIWIENWATKAIGEKRLWINLFPPAIVTHSELLDNPCRCKQKMHLCEKFVCENFNNGCRKIVKPLLNFLQTIFSQRYIFCSPRLLEKMANYKALWNARPMQASKCGCTFAFTTSNYIQLYIVIALPACDVTPDTELQERSTTPIGGSGDDLIWERVGWVIYFFGKGATNNLKHPKPQGIYFRLFGWVYARTSDAKDYRQLSIFEKSTCNLFLAFWHFIPLK
jgi:hypothetical protein